MEAEIARELWRFAPPSLLVGGTVCNGLSFCVMRRTFRQRGSSTAFLLSVLAVVDCLVLWLGLPRLWLKHIFHVDIRSLHFLACKLQRYGLYLSADMSAWILSAVTMERFIAICVPGRRHAWISPRRTRNGLIALMTLLAVADSPVLWARGLEHVQRTDGNVTFNETDQCGYTSPEARFFWENVAPWTTLFLYHGGPATIMIILNMAIIRTIAVRGRRQVEKPAVKSAPLRGDLSNSREKLQRHLNSLTPTFLLVTFLFLLLNAPSFFNFLHDTLGSGEFTFETEGGSQLFEAIVLLLMYLNHTINFIAYCLSAARFRRHFLDMIAPLCACRLARSQNTEKQNTLPIDKANERKLFNATCERDEQNDAAEALLDDVNTIPHDGTRFGQLISRSPEPFRPPTLILVHS